METQPEPNFRTLTSGEFRGHLHSESSSSEDEVASIVHEFLLKNGCFNTLEAFRYEILNKGSNMEAYVRNTEKNLRFGELLLLEVSAELTGSCSTAVRERLFSSCGIACSRSTPDRTIQATRRLSSTSWFTSPFSTSTLRMRKDGIMRRSGGRWGISRCI